MIVATKPAARLDAIVSAAFGVTILVVLVRSPYPADVISNLTSNLHLAALSVVVCAVGFGCAALFFGSAVNAWLAYSMELELTDDGVVLSSLLKSGSMVGYDDVTRLVAVPSESEITGWLVEFRDGSSFGANDRCVNFREGFEWLRGHTEIEPQELSIGELVPSRRTPSWLKRLLNR